MTEATPLPPVPQSLLGPLLQWAGEYLHELKGEEVPPALRPLLGFDRRGFGSAAARTQLRKALEGDPAFRQAAFAAFAERDDVTAVLDGWTAEEAVERGTAAAERDDLALLASALVAVRPEGWELGLGVAVAVHEQVLARRASDDDRRAYETQIAKADEARRRAEEHAREAKVEHERVVDELRVERASRRDREEAAKSDADALAERVAVLEAELEAVSREVQRAEARAAREAERAAAAEEATRTARAEADTARAEADTARADADTARADADAGGAAGVEAGRGGSPPVAGDDDVAVLLRAAEVARRLAGEAPGGGRPATATPAPPRVAEREPVAPAVEGGGPAGTPRERHMAPGGGAATGEVPGRPATATGRRARVPVPAGMVGTSPEGVEAALRTGQPVVVVDGYNVTMAAWPDTGADAQRQRLCALLERLHLRMRVPVTVVFDGADVEGVRPPQRPGVRVLFSAADEEADDVVVREVRALPPERPAVVVSSDRWVQDHSERAGALAVRSETFLEVLRR